MRAVLACDQGHAATSELEASERCETEKGRLVKMRLRLVHEIEQQQWHCLSELVRTPVTS